MPSDAVRPVEARLQEIVFPDHANHLGTLFGGQALAWMDKAAFIAASRYARTVVVTARSEQIDFHTSVPKGALVDLVARVVETGRTSMQVEAVPRARPWGLLAAGVLLSVAYLVYFRDLVAPPRA